jgi:hypothetical protein
MLRSRLLHLHRLGAEGPGDRPVHREPYVDLVVREEGEVCGPKLWLELPR